MLTFAIVLAAFAPMLRTDAASLSEITVDLRLDESTYVAGERMRCVVDVRNMSPDKISVGRADSPDHLLIEVFRASDHEQMDRRRNRPFVSPFKLDSNEGQKLEAFLADHYPLEVHKRYLARPVLVHGGTRFEGLFRSFDVVPGTRVSGAMQMFSNRKGLSREFELLRWSRQGTDHLFLAAKDSGENGRKWVTTDIGPVMNVTKPTISIMPSGEVIVLHRNGIDSLVRSMFWSLPDALELRSRELVLDPETAGQRRIQQQYGEPGSVKPADRPWWKFW